jgi:hypothetical protein
LKIPSGKDGEGFTHDALFRDERLVCFFSITDVRAGQFLLEGRLTKGR